MKFTTATLLALALAGVSQAAPTSSKQSRSISKRAPPKLGGVNLSGFDFGCGTDGTCGGGGYVAPADGFKGQIDYFTGLGANTFRIPVGWQYLVGSKIGGSLDPTFFKLFDGAMQNCLGSGSYCIIDPHNYAQWNGAYIGTSGAPTAAQFASFWGELAGKYASEDHAIFSMMNEPHGLPSVQNWADAMQGAVTAIRAAGATSQYIILNGNDWTHGKDWISGADDPILKVTDADGSTDMLLLDIHEYLDSDDSGTSNTCSTDNVDLINSLQTYFAGIGRTGIVTETGVANDATCITDLNAELKAIQSSANLAGFTVWGAGEFGSGYGLSIYPTNDIVTQAIAPNLPGSSTPPSTVETSGSISPSAPTSTAVPSEATSSSGGGVTVTAGSTTDAAIPVSSASTSAVEAYTSPAAVTSAYIAPAEVTSAYTAPASASASASSSEYDSETNSVAASIPTTAPVISASATGWTCAAQKTVTVTVQPGGVTPAGTAPTGVASSSSASKHTKTKKTRTKTHASSFAATDAAAYTEAVTGLDSAAETAMPTVTIPAGNLAVTGGGVSSSVATGAVSSAVSMGSAPSCPAGSPGRKRSLVAAELVGQALM